MKITEWNAFDYLQTQEEINAYLSACFNESDPKIFINALGDLAKKHGMNDVAQAIGVNRESLYRSLNGKVAPRFDTIHKIMRVLNVQLTVNPV